MFREKFCFKNIIERLNEPFVCVKCVRWPSSCLKSLLMQVYVVRFELHDVRNEELFVLRNTFLFRQTTGFI